MRLFNKANPIGRQIFFCLLLFPIIASSQGITLSKEVEIDVPEGKPQPNFYYDVALYSGKLYILSHDPDSKKSELWKQQETGFEKYPIKLPDSIERNALIGGFDINDKYFSYADISNIYIGLIDTVKKTLTITQCIPNFQRQNRIATNLSLQSDTLQLSTYEYIGIEDKFKSYFIKYHIPSKKFFDTIFAPLKNTGYASFNSIEPIASNGKYSAFAEPHQYNIKVLKRGSKDTITLTRSDLFFWKPVRQDSADILFNDEIDVLRLTSSQRNTKGQQLAFYAFNCSNINKLFFLSDSRLGIIHAHPHLKQSYIDVWKLFDTSAILVSRNMKFSDETAFYNAGTNTYTVVPPVRSSAAFFSRNNKMVLLNSNIFLLNRKSDKLIIQVFDVK